MAKRPNKKNMNKDLLDELFNPDGNIAFLDAEFNAGMNYSAGEKVNDIISIGIVICDKEYNGIKKFYTLVRPLTNTPIFPMISRMTGITTDMLEGQPNFAEVSNKITDIIKKYDVKKIYTWGAADKHSLETEKVLFKKRKFPGHQYSNKWNYIDLCTDISSAISAQHLGIMGGLAINMENLMFVCDIDKKQEHNALSDARYLFKCVKYLKSHYPLSNGDEEFFAKRILVNQYYQEKSTYNSYRRFKNNSKSNDLYNTWNDLDDTDMRIKALEDDIKFLKGEIPMNMEFETIQEFFDRSLFE